MQLERNQLYTFKVNSGSLWQFTGEDTLKDRISFYLEDNAVITSMERPSLDRNWLVRITVTNDKVNSDTIAFAIRQGFQQSSPDFSNAYISGGPFVGETTTNIFSEIAQETMSTVSVFTKGAGDTVKPLGDWALKLVWGIAIAFALGFAAYLIGRSKT